MRCLELTTFQSEGEDGEVLEMVVLVAARESGVLVGGAGGAVVGGESDMGAVSTGMLELRTTLWALTGRSSLGARVTSVISTAASFPVLDERS